MVLQGKLWEKIVFVLVGVGALNWGLDRFFSFNVVDWLLSLVGLASFSLYVYGAIGLSGAYYLYKIFKR
mgnify:CR=1 FL=1